VAFYPHNRLGLLLLAIVSLGVLGSGHAQDTQSDPWVIKEYPDGSKILLRLSEIKKEETAPGKEKGTRVTFYEPGGQTNRPVAPGRLAVPTPVQSKPSPSPKPSAPAPIQPAATTASTGSTEARPSTGTPAGGTALSPGFDKAAYTGMGPSLSYGQAFQDYGPKSLQTAPLAPGARPEVEAEDVPKGQDVVVAQVLMGVVLVPGPESIAAGGRPGVRGVVSTVPGLDPAVAQKIAEPYLGRPATLADLNRLCRDFSSYFIDQNQPVVTAVLPEQQIRDGVVQILLLRGKLGRVIADGARYFDPEDIEQAVRLQEGDDINLQTLTDDVNWLNSTPFRQVEPTLTPGKKPGTTDIVLETRDRFPVRPFISYDNFGIQSLGYDRYSAGLSLIDIWSGLDQQINWQYLTSGGFTSLISNNGSYSLNLPWQHNLTFFGGYSSANPDTDTAGLSGTGLSQSGYYWQISGRYNIPLPTLSLLEGLDFRHQTYLGYDYKISNTDIFFNGSALAPGAGVGLYSISQFVAGYTMNLTDPLGFTTFEGVMFGSPGGMNSNNNDTTFETIAPGARAAYVYGKLSLQRVFRLPLDGSLILSGQIQQANTNLMPSESFGIGGYDTVRGYDQRSANGDNAYLGNIEIRSPTVSLIGEAFGGGQLDQLVFLGFLDYGQVLQYDTLPGDYAVNWHLLSIGPGLRYNIGPYLSVRFDWGFQLQRAPAGTTGGLGGRSGTSQAVLSATVAY